MREVISINGTPLTCLRAALHLSVPYTAPGALARVYSLLLRVLTFLLLYSRPGRLPDCEFLLGGEIGP
jgi:hypothetical protein